MSSDSRDPAIHRFVKAYCESKQGTIAKQSNESFTVKFQNETELKEYTYQPAVSREKEIPLITLGSPVFQQILKECQQNGIVAQILLKPKESYEAVIRCYFKDSSFACQECEMVTIGKETVGICPKTQPCYHQINNGKIIDVRVLKTEPVRYFQFYFSVTFHNRLRPKNEETLALLIGEKETDVSIDEFDLQSLLQRSAVEIQDCKMKIKADVFERLKAAADAKLDAILREKLVLFDLPLGKEKEAKLRSFNKRLRRERREQVISRNHNFDYLGWQSNYEALLKREEESYITNITIKFVNLLVINTTKVKAEVTLDNHATIESSFNLGTSYNPEVICPICHRAFCGGYATQDGLYVCGNCVRESIDTGKVYSKRARLTLDETLKEYIEADLGFVCSVCGRKHSRLLEFRCSHDNSSVCISHYDLCDSCGKVFSKSNLSYTDEFQRLLCPKHAPNDRSKEKQ